MTGFLNEVIALDDMSLVPLLANIFFCLNILVPVCVSLPTIYVSIYHLKFTCIRSLTTWHH